MMEPRLPLLVGLMILAPGHAGAQERQDESPRNDSARFFRKPVDLWNAGLAIVQLPSSPGAEEALPSRVAIRGNVWAQPIRTPDGSWMIYVPPKHVLDFLENPSEGTAKAYLDWKREQTEKLRKAMELLTRIKGSEAPASGAVNASDPAKPTAAPPGFPFRMTYFKKSACPHCVSQDAVLAGWLKHRPEGKLEVLLPGEREELWKAFDVRGTPTLVLEGGSPARKVVLIGLQGEVALETVLGRLSVDLGGPKDANPKEIPR